MKMTQELIEKLKGHTDHVLGLYLLLAEKYALIDPMFFGKRVVRRFGCAERARGFDLIRKSVYFACLQDLANICFDKQDKTPSICKLVEKLKSHEVQEMLRHNYSQYPINTQNSDPNIRVSLQKYRKQREVKLAKRFDRELIG
jgi:AbiU2